MKKTILLSTFLSIVLLAVYTSIGMADDGVPVSDDAVNEIAGQLYCPICENVPLDVCPTQACADWRELIRGFLAEGKSEDEIKAYFSTQYGWNVLSVPPCEGLNWLIYVLPPLLTIGGLLLVTMIVRKSKLTVKIEKQVVIQNEYANAEDYLKIIECDLQNEEHNG